MKQNEANKGVMEGLHPNDGWGVLLCIDRTLDQLFIPFCSFFLSFSCFFAKKNGEKHTSTSIWSAHHPNIGQNIQKIAVKTTISLTRPNIKVYFVMFVMHPSILGSEAHY